MGSLKKWRKKKIAKHKHSQDAKADPFFSGRKLTGLAFRPWMPGAGVAAWHLASPAEIE